MDPGSYVHPWSSQNWRMGLFGTNFAEECVCMCVHMHGVCVCVCACAASERVSKSWTGQIIQMISTLQGKSSDTRGSYKRIFL